jgi:PKD repeat protein
MRVQGGGIHRVSQDHKRIHFGLAKNTLVDRLTIQWPSGIIQMIDNLPADQIITVVELDFMVSEKAGKPPLHVAFFSNTKAFYKPISYKWDFDNNGTIDSTVQNPSYTYIRPGLYTVKLIVTDIEGGTYTSIREDYIKILGDK